jgi:hypothetical protein
MVRVHFECADVPTVKRESDYRRKFAGGSGLRGKDVALARQVAVIEATGAERPTLGNVLGFTLALPPNVSHHWINIGDSPGQVMAIVSPGGCEQLFIEIAKLDRPMPAEIAAIEKRLGIINEETRRLLD